MSPLQTTMHSLIERIIYIVLISFSAIIVFLNRGWQLLDDGDISANSFFPYNSPKSTSFRNNGREFSGIGVFLKLANFITGTNNLALWVINLLIVLVIFFLALRIAVFFELSKSMKILLLVALIVVPSGPEEYLSLLRIEKFSVLAIELIVFSVLRELRYSKSSNLLLYLSGLSTGILLGKETFIIFLGILFYFECLRRGVENSNNNYLGISGFGLIIFTIYRLFPGAFNHSNNQYTDQNFSLDWNESLRILSFYFARSTSTFVIMFCLVALILFFVFNREKKSLVDLLFLSLSLCAIGEFLFYLFCWKQFVVVYVYQVDFLGALCLFYFIARFRWQESSFLKILLAFVLMFNTNYAYSRSLVSVSTHQIDRLALDLAFKSKNGYYFSFPSNSEMPWNIQQAARVSGALAPAKSILDLRCGGILLVPDAPSQNSALGMRGNQWGSLETQESINPKIALDNRVFYRDIELRTKLTVVVTGMSDGISIRQFIPNIFHYEYGWVTFKKICS